MRFKLVLYLPKGSSGIHAQIESTCSYINLDPVKIIGMVVGERWLLVLKRESEMVYPMKGHQKAWQVVGEDEDGNAKDEDTWRKAWMLKIGTQVVGMGERLSK